MAARGRENTVPPPPCPSGMAHALRHRQYCRRSAGKKRQFDVEGFWEFFDKSDKNCCFIRLFRRKRTAWPCQICISGYQFCSNHPDSKQFSVEMHRFRHIAGKTRQNVSVSTFELYSSHIIHIYIVFFVISFSIQEAIDGKINGSSRKVWLRRKGN